MVARTFRSVALATVVLALPGPVFAGTVALKETGSTLIEPLFRTWATDYAAAHPDVTVTTAGTGSGQGTADAFSGAAQIGTSDAYLTDDEVAAHPGFIDVALAISAVAVVYNLPDVREPLKLDGPTLAGIFSGAVRGWDDKAIAALNPGIALPHHDIIPVRRTDGSGDTFVFTQYLSFTTTPREDDVGTTIDMPNGSWGDSVGYGTTVTWPTVTGAQDVKGNDGMVDVLGKTPYAIGYAGLSYSDAIAQAKLVTASMGTFSGQFVQPSADTIAAAAGALTPRTPADERLTLVNAPGASCYPLINYEYAVVSKSQPDKATATALRDFLSWTIVPGPDTTKRVVAAHMVVLPPSIWLKSQTQINSID